MSETNIDPFDRARAEAMLCGYHARWAEAMADYEVAFVEAEFRAPRLAEVARENYADR